MDYPFQSRRLLRQLNPTLKGIGGGLGRCESVTIRVRGNPIVVVASHHLASILSRFASSTVGDRFCLPSYVISPLRFRQFSHQSLLNLVMLSMFAEGETR